MEYCGMGFALLLISSLTYDLKIWRSQMHANSSNTKRFLYAAKLAEQKTLRQLSDNCFLVTVICKLIHELQKERGVSNIYLASHGAHYSQRRNLQIKASELAQKNLMEILNKHYLETKQNTDNHRLLFSITLCLQGIDNLPNMRLSIERHKVKPLESTQAYCRLIGALMSIVFEAADISNDAKLTKQLVALFNFIQAKEHSGQERAWGAIGFADSHFTTQICARLEQLQQSQMQSIEVFLEYSNQAHRDAWTTLTHHKVSSEIAKFRQLISQLRDGEAISPEISEVWYELTTQRIDQMYLIEHSLSEQLLRDAKRRVQESSDELKKHQDEVAGYANTEPASSSLITMFRSDMPGLLGIDDNDEGINQADVKNIDSNTHLHRSIYDLLRKQAQRIDEMSGELCAAKNSLFEHKLVSRAKLLLIEQLKLSETEAHQKLQQASMRQGIGLAEVAKNIIAANKGKANTSIKMT